MDKIVRNAFINALGTALYVVVVASFIYSLQGVFPKETNTVFIPIAMLLLFVFSAAFTGMLVFGKPIMMYLDGKKKEAFSLIGYTLGILLLITFLVFILIVVYFGFFV